MYDAIEYVVCSACVELQIKEYDTTLPLGTEELKYLLNDAGCGLDLVEADARQRGALGTRRSRMLMHVFDVQ